MFANPQENLQKFGLSDGAIVADLGASTGHYALVAAKMVGSGKVYAVDVQKDLLDKLKNEAIAEKLTNVEIIWGNVEKLGGTKLRDAGCDAVIVSNIFFQLEDRETFAKEVTRILKPNGRIFFVDWSDSSGGIGPGKMIVTPADAKAFWTKHGFSVVNEIPAGSHHYGLIIRKKTS